MAQWLRALCCSCEIGFLGLERWLSSYEGPGSVPDSVPTLLCTAVIQFLGF